MSREPIHIKGEIGRMSGLEVQGLVKHNGEKLVVDAVSMHVKERELLVLMGPPNSGKSTVLRLICGLEIPDSGCIKLDGRDITHIPAHQRNMGAILRDLGLYPHLNVFDNIAFGLRNQRMQAAEIEMRTTSVAHMLSLNDVLKRPVTGLTGEEKQRVILARSLVKNSDAYLFDEPLADVEPNLRYQARREILMAHRIAQKPGVYIAHDQTDAFALSSRIAVMNEGKIQQIGTQDELVHQPANIFVAQFVGIPPMNLLQGYLQRLTNCYRILAGDLFPMLSTQWNYILGHYGQPEIVLGIRPDSIVPEWAVDQRQNRPYYVLRAQVKDMEMLARRAVVQLSPGGKSMLTAVFSRPEADRIRIGQVIVVGIDVEQICLFDVFTRQALYHSPA